MNRTGTMKARVSCMYKLKRAEENLIQVGSYKMLWYPTDIVELLKILHVGVQPMEGEDFVNNPKLVKVC